MAIGVTVVDAVVVAEVEVFVGASVAIRGGGLAEEVELEAIG